jgi:hypothetical protein
MDNIITPTATFDFSTLNLENPLPLQGGSFFTKLNFSDKSLPLYVQLPRAESKHGIVRNASTKKAYIDLLFGFFENNLQTWFENLEIRCRELIFEKKDLWFQTDMTADDIENTFISPSKSYRSGKFITVRAHLPTSRQIKQDSCMIYDESERQLDSSVITGTTKFIPLIHIEGIRFSSKSFQVEINVRQIMVLSLEDTIKKSCMIKYGKTGTEEPNTLESLEPEDFKNPNPLETTEQNLSENDKGVEIIEAKTLDTLVNKEDTSSGTEIAAANTEIENQEKTDDKVDVVDLPQDTELHEVDLAVGGDNESISLKNPKDVYYEIYKVAYEKAKHMKQVALEAHLEAQNIKNKYMLDDILASDDELSNYSEIEE